MSRRSKVTFSPAKVTLVGMSGLAVVLNTGDALLAPDLLYSRLSWACIVTVEAMSSATINNIFFILCYTLSLADSLIDKLRRLPQFV